MSHNQQNILNKTGPLRKENVSSRTLAKQKCADPYQHDQAVFDETCQLIQQCVADWKPYI